MRIHTKTLTVCAGRERPEGVPGVSVPFSCWALEECGPVVSLGPLDPEPAPYIKAQ